MNHINLNARERQLDAAKMQTHAKASIHTFRVGA